MENNDYYEPKIKTSRKSLIHDELGIKIGEEVITSYKICTDDCISKAKLISFLKDKIKENQDYIKKLDYDEVEYSDFIRTETLKEVLNFVSKGDE